MSCSDRTVKIWRARGGLDGTLEVVDSVDEVASNWTRYHLPGLTLEGRKGTPALHFDPLTIKPKRRTFHIMWRSWLSQQETVISSQWKLMH